MGPEENLAGPAQMVEHTTNGPYTKAELVDLGKQFQQWSGEPLAVWLLHFWDLGVDNIMHTDNEMEKLASILIRLSLHQTAAE